MQYLLLQSDLILSILQLYIYINNTVVTSRHQTQFNIYYTNNLNQEYKELYNTDEYIQKIIHFHYPTLHTSVMCAFVIISGYSAYYHMVQHCTQTNYDEPDSLNITNLYVE